MRIKRIAKHKVLIVILLIVVIGLGAFGLNQERTLHKAHSTFDNYYAFRGCTQLIKREPTYGVCKTGSGQTITIVQYHGKWYLKGDLPLGMLGHLI